MDLNTFYAVVAGTCFTLVGLWWNVVQTRPDWVRDSGLRELAGGVYLSFLIPGVMSLGAQVGGPNDKVFWRLVFVSAAVLGGFFTTRLILRTSKVGHPGPFRRWRWLSLVLYALIFFFGLLPEVASWVGLEPLQAEALLLCVLMLLGHGLAWEFMTEPRD